MQLLTFSIAGEPFAIEARLVIEVLPLVPARPIPQPHMAPRVPPRARRAPRAISFIFALPTPLAPGSA